MYSLVIDIIKVIVIASAVLTLIPVLIWWERKGAAYIQDRRGPNRANIFGIRLGGLIHNIADVFKLLFKEDIIPQQAHKLIYLIAPIIVMGVAVSTLAVIPFTAPVKLGDFVIKMQIADLNVGIIYILAIASLGVYGVILAGWSSNNVYSLFGGLRSSAQMISYEVAMGLALLSVIMSSGTVRLDEIAALQGINILEWNFIRQPLAFILFLTCLFAETNRNPFDLPEGESELVAGYHTEYSSMKFALFFMAEYAHIIVGSMILVSLFFGGWQIPFLSTEFMHDNMNALLKLALPVVSVSSIAAGVLLMRRTKKFGWGDARDFEPLVFGLPAVIFGFIIGIAAVFSIYLNEYAVSIITAAAQGAIFLVKTLFFCWLFIWVRWTLPRFRYDQLMKLGWQIMVPLALINIIITGIVISR
ncbi:MAG: NADH-quinone oxidoreductase subunit H [Deltaproteobacteria bacterium]|nr:NADH-quinone oxidoreductase subunit H [Deltaproteobacteria bacterium]MBI2974056.1 NADH-quinone oxidoreductase subunit H [Deltaproteobacteria bacterium]